MKAFKIKRCGENSDQYDNQRWLPSLRFLFFFQISEIEPESNLNLHMQSDYILAKENAQITIKKWTLKHLPQLNFNKLE